MARDTLHVVTCLANPLGWQSRYRNLRRAIENWLENPHVHVTLVECVYPGFDSRLSSYASERVTYERVRARTICWNKESLLNIGIRSLPDDARFIATLDADILFNEVTWAEQTVEKLRYHRVVQPWMLAFDLGPRDEHTFKHKSFGFVATRNWRKEEPFNGYWLDPDDNQIYGHPGFAWAWRRSFLQQQHGLIDAGVLGSGDRHMAFGLIGYAHRSMPPGQAHNYNAVVNEWGYHATIGPDVNLGYVVGTVNHLFHGMKCKRAYHDRWHILERHRYDPLMDTFHNHDGVLELTGNKPGLSRDILDYFKSRDEDASEIEAAPEAEVA